jgi:hypothetical protein
MPDSCRVWLETVKISSSAGRRSPSRARAVATVSTTWTLRFRPSRDVLVVSIWWSAAGLAKLRSASGSSNDTAYSFH